MLLFTFAAILAGSVSGQVQIIRNSRVQKSRGLAGTVMFLNEKPASGARVEDCHENWQNCDSSVSADDSGRFVFPNADKRRLHYVKVFWPDANPIEVVIKITGNGKDVVLTLRPAG
jgi:hypothetical protein